MKTGKKLRVVNGLTETVEEEYKKSPKDDQDCINTSIIILKIQEVKKPRNEKEHAPSVSCFSCLKPFRKAKVVPKRK